MPKFLVTNGSNFQPFTYDELTRPLYEMAEAKRNTQDQYDALSMQTEALRNYISDNEDDKRAKAMYDNYVSKLNALQDNLWSHGYTASTRRDLNAARSAFSSDIARLGKAIENRQARSAEYNKFRHDHPDMVMGSDPGLGGLDNYLDNDLYGTDWYQYSGNQFMSEVGADAKARANEMLNNPEIMRDPRLAGYITKITREGFSNDEVDAAGAAVKAHLAGDSSYLGNLDPASSILANVLLTHLESTGAAGNVSDAEFNRLVDYGINGLSQAVGKTHTQELSDKVWDANRQYNMWYRQENQRRAWARQDAEDAAEKARQQNNLGYNLNHVSMSLTGPEYDKILKQLRDNFITPFESPVDVKIGDAVETIKDPVDANNILDRLGRADIRAFLGGIDPESPTYGEGTLQKAGGGVEKVRVRQYANGILGVQVLGDDGKWNIDDDKTDEFNRRMSLYEQRKKDFSKDNNDIDISKMSLSDQDIRKIYDKSGLPSNIPLEFAPYVLATKSGVMDDKPVVIADAHPQFAKTRDALKNLITDAYSKEESQRKIGKGSSYAFYPVKGGAISDKGVKYEDVFGKNGDAVITSCDFLLNDIDSGKPMVTITLSDRKRYAIDPRLLGEQVQSQMNNLSSIMPSIMRPVLHPESVFDMGNKEINEWRSLVKSAFGDYISLDMKDGDSIVQITPLDVVINPDLRQLMRNLARDFSERVMQSAINNVMNNPMRVPGYTATEPTYYNN